MPLAELYVTDGTTTVDLLGDGLCLIDWRPSYPGMKGGGTWQSSPLADGRRLAQYRYDHVVDVFTLNGRSFTQDAMIRSLQELNRLLIKARQYWTADWQDEPVYIVAKSGRETNTRYALIHSYDFPEDGSPYGQPFAKNWGRIGMEGLTLAIEHALWQSTIPGEGDCTEVYATEDYEASVSIDKHVSASSDDAHVQVGINAIWKLGTALIFGRSPPGTGGQDEHAGMRFQPVNVPQGATILWAYVQFQCPVAKAAVTMNTLVSCEDADDTATFSTYGNFMGRPRTAGVAWSPGAWVINQFYYTPDIATEVQTVVDRVGWVSGNNMVVFVFENGSTAVDTERYATAWDHGSLLEPVLFIGYASDVTYGRERGVCPSNLGETFVANKDVMANIDHIYWYDASALMWSGNLVGTMTYDLFNSAVAIATGDFVLFGIETVTGAGLYTLPVFSSLVFDLIPAVYVPASSMSWSYSNGGPGWTAFPNTLRDNTAAAANEPLSVAGVCSVHWTHPSAWAEQADGPVATTCLWVKLQATVAGSISVPQQQNRDVYQVAWPYIEVDDGDVGGDVAAQIRAVMANVCTHGYPTAPIPSAKNVERLLIGLRSLDRGIDFSAYLNCGDEQNHADITLLPIHGGTGFANGYFSGAGRVMNWVSGGPIPGLTRLFRITIASTLSAQYYGSYRVFLRVRGSGAGISTTFAVHVLNSAIETVWRGLEVQHTWIAATLIESFDMGTITLPGGAVFKPSEYQSQVILNVNGYCSANITLDFIDLILLPTDEWNADLITRGTYGNTWLTDLEYLHMDSVHYPKRDLRAMLFEISSGDTLLGWQALASESARLQANVGQRLWFFAPRPQESILIAPGYMQSSPEICLTVDVDRAQRYLSMRGDR